MYTTKRQNKSYHAFPSHFMLGFNISYKIKPPYSFSTLSYTDWPSTILVRLMLGDFTAQREISGQIRLKSISIKPFQLENIFDYFTRANAKEFYLPKRDGGREKS